MVVAWCSGSVQTSNYSFAEYNIVASNQNEWATTPYVYTLSVSGSLQSMAEQRAGTLRYAAYSGAVDARIQPDTGLLFGSANASGAILWGSLSGSRQDSRERGYTSVPHVWQSPQASGSILWGSVSGAIIAARPLADTIWYDPNASGSIYLGTISGSIQAELQYQTPMVGNIWGSPNASGSIAWGSVSGTLYASTPIANTIWQVNVASGSIYLGSLSGSLQMWNQISGPLASVIYYDSYSGSQNAIINEFTILTSAAYSGSLYSNVPSTASIDYGLLWNNQNASGAIYWGSLSGSIQAELQYQSSMVGNIWGLPASSGSIYWGSLSGAVQALKQQTGTATVSFDYGALWNNQNASGSIAWGVASGAMFAATPLANVIWSSPNASGSIYLGSLSGSLQMWNQISGPLAGIIYYDSYSGSQNAIINEYGYLISSTYSGAQQAGTPLTNVIWSSPNASGAIYLGSLSGSLQMWNQISGPLASVIYYDSYSGSQNAIINEYGYLISSTYSGTQQVGTPLANVIWSSPNASGAIYWGSLSGSIQAELQYQTPMVGNIWGSPNTSGAILWGTASGALYPATPLANVIWNSPNASGSIYLGSLSGSLQAQKQYQTPEITAIWQSALASGTIYLGSVSGSIQGISQSLATISGAVYYGAYSGAQNAILNEFSIFVSAAYSGSIMIVGNIPYGYNGWF